MHAPRPSTFCCKLVFALALVVPITGVGQQAMEAWGRPSASAAQVQSDTVVQERPLAWAEGWGRDPENGMLPFVQDNRELPAGSTDIDPRLVDAVYAELTPAELALLPGIGRPPADIVLEHGVGVSRGTAIGMVRFSPFRSDPATGKVMRLVSYELDMRASSAGLRSGLRNDYPMNSIMSGGQWFRFTVTEDGVYRIDLDMLRRLGVPLDGLRSDAINVYGNHEGMLPLTNTPFRPTDLKPMAIEVVDGGDGYLDGDDHLIFYASGPLRWVRGANGYQHVQNLYSITASYFIGINVQAPVRIVPAAPASGPATQVVNAFVDRQVVDRDLVSVINSGRIMFSEVYDQVTTYNYSFSLPNIRADKPVVLTASLFARSINNRASSFLVRAGQHERSVPIAAVNGHYEHAYGSMGSATLSFTHTAPVLPITVTFQKNDPLTSIGYMDYLSVNAYRDLRMVGDQLQFRDTAAVGAGVVGEVVLAGGGIHRIWDITDPNAVRSMALVPGTAEVRFTADMPDVREFIAFRNAGFKVPEPIGRVENQDLHGTPLPVDLVIVVPDPFRGEAERLARRRIDEGLRVRMVSPQEIYNEFSSGQRDISAIRRYMKMLYDRAGTEGRQKPRYLLLFGDGVFNNLLPESTGQNWIPSYQSYDSWSPGSSYTSDDFYAMLDDAEGEGGRDLPDIGVGRLPVNTQAQARAVVDKILNYDRLALQDELDMTCASGSEAGANDWRNWIAFISDDQDGAGAGNEPFHTNNSDTLAKRVQARQPWINQSKIYMDAFTQYATPGGQRYPDGARAIRERVQKGALVVNYIGHGGEVGWGHERFLDMNTILGWTNAQRLPLFMTATCEFSRWDSPGHTSAGENVLLNPNGGGVALFTTTRLAYSSTNQTINLAFYEQVFKENTSDGANWRMGDTYRATKVAVSSNSNQVANIRSFAFLGDPSIRLAVPRKEVYITAITDTLGNPLDTMKALSVVRIQGHVGTATTPDARFNGLAVPLVFDKASQQYTLANDPPSNPIAFRSFKNTLYRGKSTVTEGRFSVDLVVPRDINYALGTGRISVYAESDSTNATGSFERFVVGGADANAVPDEKGPAITLHLNDERFVNGGITNEAPLLVAKLFDESGINTTGNSIGHDLLAVIDANTPNAIVLNEMYEADKDTYKSGQVRYRLSKLAEGPHTLSFKAWDVFNNSSEREVEFVVANSEELALERVLNYPNPFTTRTEFYFEHNRPCTTLECQVQVFTVAGRLVKTINRRLNCDGFRSEPLAWDGLDDFGDKLARGVYVYRLSITAPDGTKADKLEKLVILR